jgi:flagellar basal-body rod protein FlgG
MMRSLWTAASGMTSQQTAVDVIANNLANVNTTGYKTQSAQFKTLLYQTSQAVTTSANGDTKPVGAQVGLGVRNSAIATSFTQGSLSETEEDTDFAIDGEGFFQVQNADGDTLYTRNGSFTWTPMGDGTMMLCDSNGYGVLDTTGAQIVLDEEYDMSQVTIDTRGNICYPDENNQSAQIGIQIGLVQFNNPGGLTKASDSNYIVSDASGEPISEADGGVAKTSTLRQGYLEASNVNVATEMVNLIVAQRAYEMNSKAITTSDDMLQQANQLKR